MSENKFSANATEIEHVVPSTWRVDDASGAVSIGGCALTELLETHGSPLYVYCEKTFRDACVSFREAFASAYAPGEAHVEYSSKAFPHPAAAAIVAAEGLYLDVVSGGELAMAMAGNMPAERCNYHGNNKSVAELAEAIDVGIGRITVDSTVELDRIDKLAKQKGVKQRVMLRISPSVDPVSSNCFARSRPKK